MEKDSVLLRWYRLHEKEYIFIICFINQYDILPSDVVKYIIYLYADTHWDNILKLKEKYRGSEDEYVEKYINTSHKLNIRYSETIKFSGYGNFGYRTFIFPKSILSKYVYKNLRIIGDQNNIGYCRLERSGNDIDKIYKPSFSAMRFIYGINDEYLPFSFCKKNEYLIANDIDTKVICSIENNAIISEDDISLVVDIYEIIDNNDINGHSIITQNQFTGQEFIVNCILPRKYKLYFNYIINHIIITVSKGKIINFDLNLGSIYPILNMSNAIIYNNQYIIPFTKDINNFNYGINFSRPDAMLTITFDKNYDYTNEHLCIYAVGYNVINTLKNTTVLEFTH